MPPPVVAFDEYHGEDDVLPFDANYRSDANDLPAAADDDASVDRDAMRSSRSTGRNAAGSIDDESGVVPGPPSDDDRAIATAAGERGVIFANDASSRRDGRYAPRIVPSFMKPARVRAMTTMGGTTTLADDDVGGAVRESLPAEASSGNSGTTQLESLSRQLEHLVLTMYRLNGGIEFNVNSPRQVARVLFGEDVDGDTVGDTSTAKDALEAMASAGNEMA